MNNRVFMWSCLVMTFFVACQQTEVEILEAEELPLSISASINSQSEKKSRYVGDEPSVVEFDNDDAIGLFMDGGFPLEWNYDGSEWSSGDDVIVYWPDKTESHTFSAFYPYLSNASFDAVPMPSLKEQVGRTVDDISHCDFLVAEVSQSYEEGSVVEFTNDHAFQHVSTLLKLTFKGGGDLAASVLTSVTIEGEGIVSPSTYSFEDSKVTLLSDDESDVLTVVGEYPMSSDQVFYLVVNEKLDEEANVRISVRYKTGETTYLAQKDGFAGNVFVGGYCQSYTMTIKDSSLTLTGSQISAWGTGESLDDIIINGEETVVS